MPYMKLAVDSRFYDVYYVRNSDERATYYCDPACFEWICQLGKEHECDNINMMKMMLPLESLVKKPIEKGYKPYLWLTLIHEFPILEGDTRYLVSIFNFFKQLESNRNYSEKERLERAVISGSYPRVPHELMERLVGFAFNKAITKQERLRVSMSHHIRPFIRKKYLE